MAVPGSMLLGGACADEWRARGGGVRGERGWHVMMKGAGLLTGRVGVVIRDLPPPMLRSIAPPACGLARCLASCRYPPLSPSLIGLPDPRGPSLDPWGPSLDPWGPSLDPRGPVLTPGGPVLTPGGPVLTIPVHHHASRGPSLDLHHHPAHEVDPNDQVLRSIKSYARRACRERTRRWVYCDRRLQSQPPAMQLYAPAMQPQPPVMQVQVMRRGM